MRITALVLLLAASACTPAMEMTGSERQGSTTHRRPAKSDAGGLDDLGGDDEDSAADDGVPSPGPAVPCDPAETTKLQAALDSAHAATTNAVLSVKTPCGIRFFSSGPAKYGAKTLHRIASVTKTYTGAVVVRLVQENKIKLEDRVSRWVSNVPNGETITVEQLLRHRSGLFNYTEVGDPRIDDLSRRWAPEELVAISATQNAMFAPGTQFYYSNTNYVVLGMIAQAATGESLPSLIHSRILEPLGLKETFVSGEDSYGSLDLADGVTQNGDVVYGPEANMSWAWGVGNLTATPSDVVLWMERLGAGDFHNATMQARALTLSSSDPANEPSGLGFFVMDPSITDGGGPGIGHEGDIAGFHTAAFTFPEHRTTAVAIVDADDESQYAVMNAVRPVLFGAR